MSEPLEVRENGIVIKIEKMDEDKVYSCIYNNRVFLFFKGVNGLNCYEVEDKEVAEAIKLNPDSDSIKRILKEVIQKQKI